MKFKRLYLKGFKYLMFVGNVKELDVTDMTQIVMLSGDNGKGKSSVMRELSPYPATRTDYEKNGMKIIEIQHGKDYFVLTSDFSKTGAHSFLINGEEMNISGTTDVQIDLVQQYFDGFTPLIEKLCAGQCNMSQLSRPERNKVFMATYPSSMLFILEKYKALMTKIRACGNQIKLMNERKLKLKESFMDDSTLQHHNEVRKLMNEAINAIDQDVLILRQQIKPIEEMELFSKEFDFTIEDVINKSRNICKEMYKLLNENVEFVKPNQLNATLAVLKVRHEALQQQIEQLDTRGIDLVETIDKYHQYLKTDKEQAIKDCELMIETQKSIIEVYKKDDNVPLVDKEESEQMREFSSKIQEQLDYLRTMSIEHWSEDKFIESERQLHVLEADERSLLKQIQVLDMDINKLSARLGKYTEHPYAEGCVTPCKLRESISKIVESIEIELNGLNKSKEELLVQLKQVKTKINTLKTQLEVRSPARPIIQRFERLIASKSWGYFVCSDKTFVEAVNSGVSEIWNRYVRIIKQSEEHQKAKEASELLVSLTAKLTALKTDNQPAKQIISESLIKFEKELEKVQNKKADAMIALGNIKAEGLVHSWHKKLVDDFTALEQNWDALKTSMELKFVYKFVSKMIEDLLATKNDINVRLRDLDSIVHEQENLRTRLHDEIEPVLNDLYEQKRKWEYVEKQLSPKYGLPQKNIVAYINSVFVYANRFIKQIWNYNMELEYLDPEEECDCTFSVIINGDGIVKDISNCSKGQREILDLAINLAICSYRKYTQLYPLKLDEICSGLTPAHSSKLFEQFGEMFHQSNILQAFIVSHDPIVSSSYADASYITLSEDTPLPESCRVVSKIN